MIRGVFWSHNNLEHQIDDVMFCFSVRLLVLFDAIKQANINVSVHAVRHEKLQ